MELNDKLNTFYKVLAIISVILGVVLSLYRTNLLAEENARKIEENALLIKENSKDSDEIKLKLAEIETHLIYIREAIEEKE